MNDDANETNKTFGSHIQMLLKYTDVDEITNRKKNSSIEINKDTEGSLSPKGGEESQSSFA